MAEKLTRFKTLLLSASDENLESACNDLLASITALKIQVHNANLDIKYGKPVDDEWLKQCVRALKIKGSQHQQIQVEIAQRKKIKKAMLHKKQVDIASAKSELKAKRHASLSEQFVDAARNYLPEEVFQEILLLAHKAEINNA